MTARKKTLDDLRSQRWFGATDLRSFGHRSRMLQMGYERADFTGKPIVGIINTWSDINPCHQHFRERVEHVKRGVWQAGGFPIELPALSLSENFVKPTTMLYRNLLAMEVEELLRQHPVDGAVLMGGCDKTTPGTVMGGISMDLPMIFLPAGPMMRGHFGGTILGSGSDVWKYWAEKEAGNITTQQWNDMEAGIARSAGTCMTMGTASTMTAITEALGLSLPGSASIPAADADHPRMAGACGRRIVEMIWEDLKPSDILDRRSIDNALVVHNALAGSTNAMIHLVAMAGRAGIPVKLTEFDEFAQRVPVIANLRPSGQWLMEDFHIAGGIRALMARLSPLLRLDARSVTGGTIGDGLAGMKVFNDDVIRPLDRPIVAMGGTAILYGNLAPDGCVIKPPAADPRFLNHTGPALVFDSYDAMNAAVNDLDLDVTPDHVMILRNAGPIGGPGMPEWGMLPIPKVLLRQDVRDMVRISDARMSGTSYGACILHVAPESAAGGPLAAVRDGDRITVDVPGRRIHLHLDDAEIAARVKAFRPPDRVYPRGYNRLFAQHVRQAHEGCDFDFLEGAGGIPEPEIH
ncbi:dihydroxy-acid dehydratase [Methylobacterium sp. PvP062]|uniref:Dihydroxy-acid dehydratase n=1 Tax=Methylobacterium radiotolerans TaxID=31998 RepID=A0ABV2NPR4_9HYPH|nr:MULTISPECIES: L-arabinonate dehydratase [unclassified Methylobacterium]MBP2494799.1 dihydroxy-acid dehydratase [Methylobacterium sp. PvP105]MBP2505330.1 dihydroxy-acid dehydratase [Methylobacterium sp. PvP109]MCX7334748.1 L-arabinonate dehydratase [Hyphomicrobiales bacterium]